MALVVVLFPVTNQTPTLRPAGLARLAELGVTNVALLRDGSTAGLVLEGWAFDAERASEAACAIASACEGAQTLLPLMQMAVLPQHRKDHDP